MAKVAVFLDRDGVINQDTGYVASVDDFHFIDGAIEALQLLKKKATVWWWSPISLALRVVSSPESNLCT